MATSSTKLVPPKPPLSHTTASPNPFESATDVARSSKRAKEHPSLLVEVHPSLPRVLQDRIYQNEVQQFRTESLIVTRVTIRRRRWLEVRRVGVKRTTILNGPLRLLSSMSTGQQRPDQHSSYAIPPPNQVTTLRTRPPLPLAVHHSSTKQQQRTKIPTSQPPLLLLSEISLQHLLHQTTTLQLPLQPTPHSTVPPPLPPLSLILPPQQQPDTLLSHPTT